MKYIKLLLLIIIPLVSYSQDSESYLGVKTQARLKSWDKKPSQFEKGDFKPAPFTFYMGSVTSQKQRALDWQASVSYLTSDSYYTHLELGWLSGRFFSEMLRLGVGSEVFLSLFSDESKFHETAFDNDFWGIQFLAEFYLSEQTKIYSRLKYRYMSESVISRTEDITTKTDHSTNTVFELGVKTSFNKLLLMLEYAHFNYSDTVILSKEFALRLSEDSVSRTSAGVGLKFGEVESWLKYSRLSDFEDEVSLYTMAPHFGPDYMLGKDKLELEVVWKF